MDFLKYSKVSSFNQPNVPALIQEIEALIETVKNGQDTEKASDEE